MRPVPPTLVARSMLAAAVVLGTTLSAHEARLRVGSWSLAWLNNEPVGSMDILKSCEAQERIISPSKNGSQKFVSALRITC